MSINSFFYGKKLNKMEELTIVSFLNKNNTFNLFSYSKNITDIKDKNLNIINANEILNEDKFFTYFGFGDCPTNSVGGFSDIFRFALLKKIEGWYVDMDVTCLSDFKTIDSPIVLRPHKTQDVVANIIKCNNSDFIDYIYNEYNEKIDRNNDNWVKPLEILKNAVKKFDLQKYIVENGVFGNDDADFLYKIINNNVYELENLPTHAIHWCNTACTTSMWNTKLKVDWNKPRLASLYYCLLKKNNLV